MKVPYRLRRRPAAAPVRALLLESTDVADVLALLGRLGVDPLPPVFAVPGGFLVKLPAAAAVRHPKTVCLRALADNLFLPADAGLVPTLLEDEAAGLVRGRGLVFLSSGRVLGFDLDRPVPLAELLRVPQRPVRSWQPLPDRPPLAERVESVTLDLPDASAADAVLEAGGTDIGTEEPRPADAGPASRLAGGAAMGLGRGLLWLGNRLGMQGLAGFGARLIGSGVALAPRLLERLFGRQEAALRDLLRQFREGDVEEALRRSPALSEPADRGGAPAADAQLPLNDLAYSLSRLLGDKGPLGLWLGGRDVWAELTREYHKAAEQAVRHGDYRRAAYIYGKLLRDYRRAAQALERGGLYHDAALVYLHKLDDTLAAARAFESAGEVDQALALYRRQHQHLRAADLLRRLGEEEEALAEYRLAAERLLTTPEGHLAAGQLLHVRAGRPDLARPYYEAGWQARPEPNAVACALCLIELYAEGDCLQELRRLASEAHAYLDPPGHDAAAAEFYNALAREAERPNLTALRDELRDRALLGLAVGLRRRGAVETRPGNLVSTFFQPGPAWSPALVHDADHALKLLLRPSPGAPAGRSDGPVTWVRLRNCTVTAVCAAAGTGELFVGFRDGEAVCLRPAAGEVLSVHGRPLPVVSLAADAEGKVLVVARSRGAESCELESYTCEGDGYQLTQRVKLDGPGEFWLAPQVVWAGGDWHTAFFNGASVRLLRSLLLLPEEWGYATRNYEGAWVCAAQLLGDFGHQPDRPALLVFDGNTLACGVVSWSRYEGQPGWHPTAPEGSGLKTPPVSLWRLDDESLTLAGTAEGGVVCRSVHRLTASGLTTVASGRWTGDPAYRAATIVRPGLVAAVSHAGVDWLRWGPNGVTMVSRRQLVLPTAVACFACHATDELIVVCAGGMTARLPLPS